MKRFLALSLGSAVAVLMTVSIATAAPKDKKDDKKAAAPAPAHAEGTHHLQALGEGLHGNGGFHYGNHYNAYTMHSGAGKHSGKTEPVAMSHGRMVSVLHGNAGFFYGEHYNRYTMHIGDKKEATPAPAPAAPTEAKSGSKKKK